MKQLLLITFSFALAVTGLQAPRVLSGGEPNISPARPRTWVFVIPGWQPTQAGHFERLCEIERTQSRQNDRIVIERAVELPGERGAIRVSLRVRLGKGQRCPGVAAYWPAMEFALARVARFERGKVELDDVRGVSRDDVQTTVVIEETNEN